MGVLQGLSLSPYEELKRARRGREFFNIVLPVVTSGIRKDRQTGKLTPRQTDRQTKHNKMTQEALGATCGLGNKSWLSKNQPKMAIAERSDAEGFFTVVHIKTICLNHHGIFGFCAKPNRSSATNYVARPMREHGVNEVFVIVEGTTKRRQDFGQKECLSSVTKPYLILFFVSWPIIGCFAKTFCHKICKIVDLFYAGRVHKKNGQAERRPKSGSRSKDPRNPRRKKFPAQSGRNRP